jgi:hypothetical protein
LSSPKIHSFSAVIFSISLAILLPFPCFNNPKYEYLPRIYRIRSSLFLENNDYESLSKFITQLTSKEEQLLLQKMITALDE